MDSTSFWLFTTYNKNKTSETKNRVLLNSRLSSKVIWGLLWFQLYKNQLGPNRKVLIHTAKVESIKKSATVKPFHQFHCCSVGPYFPRCAWLIIPNIQNSENGRLRRDRNTLSSQTQNSSKHQVSDSSWRKWGFQLKNTKMSPVLGNEDRTDSIAIAARANSLRFVSRVSQMKTRISPKSAEPSTCWSRRFGRPFKTAKTCRFRNLVVNQTQIPSLTSLLFTEFAPIKHTPNLAKFDFQTVWNCSVPTKDPERQWHLNGRYRRIVHLAYHLEAIVTFLHIDAKPLLVCLHIPPVL